MRSHLRLRPADLGIVQPTEVLGFLNLFGGAWDPTLAVVMAAAATSSAAVGYALARRRGQPYFRSPKPMADGTCILMRKSPGRRRGPVWYRVGSGRTVGD